MKARIPKTIRNTIIAVIVLVVLFVAAAAGYVLITGGSGDKSTPAVKSNDSGQLPSAIKPRKPAAGAPESASVQSLISPVKAGSNSSIVVKTNAGSACKITLSYNDIPYQDSGLSPKVADDYGSVTWAWTMNSSVAAGTWPIKVTCTYNGRSAVVQSNLQVVK